MPTAGFASYRSTGAPRLLSLFKVGNQDTVYVQACVCVPPLTLTTLTVWWTSAGKDNTGQIPPTVFVYVCFCNCLLGCLLT